MYKLINKAIDSNAINDDNEIDNDNDIVKLIIKLKL